MSLALSIMAIEERNSIHSSVMFVGLFMSMIIP